MSSEYMMRVRLMILLFTLFSLAVAGLNSANARFAVILRDRARSDVILGDKFELLQNNVLIDTVFMALVAASFAIYGVVIMTHTRWLRDDDSLSLQYTVLPVIMALIMVVTGGYLADHVYGFQTSFEKFGASDSIPYYHMMYYGGIAQAAYGSALFLPTIIRVVILLR